MSAVLCLVCNGIKYEGLNNILKGEQFWSLMLEYVEVEIILVNTKEFIYFI
jgi:hypothetical protein